MNQKHPEIRENQSLELLKELHILTRDGALNQDSRRKLKQVYHLYNFIEPILKSTFDLYPEKNWTLVDHGAGKSYLGFILYDLFFKEKDQGRIFGVEFRDELIKKSIELKNRLGFSRMDFKSLKVQDSISDVSIPEKVEIVTALHACDTATDDAIDFALAKNADAIVLVPCCQAEVARFLKNNKSESLNKTSLSELWRHSIHTREFGSHLTNVCRCLRLEAHGYQVTVTELVGFEHSMKNELIIAKKHQNSNPRQKRKLNELLEEFNLNELSERFKTPN